MNNETEQARETLRAVQKEEEKLKERYQIAVSEAIRVGVAEKLYGVAEWLDQNMDLYVQYPPELQRATREAFRELCGKVGIETVPEPPTDDIA